MDGRVAIVLISFMNDLLGKMTSFSFFRNSIRENLDMIFVI